MTTRRLTDDQRADALIYALTILTHSVRLAVTQWEALMQEPVEPEGDQKIAETLDALNRVNETAMHLGLGKTLRGLTEAKQRVAGHVAQTAPGQSRLTPCGSLRTAPRHQGTSPAPSGGRWGCLDVRSWRER